MHRSRPKLLHFFVERIDSCGTAVCYCDGGISVRDYFLSMIVPVDVLLSEFDNLKRSFRARSGSKYIFYVRVRNARLTCCSGPSNHFIILLLMVIVGC